MKDSDQYTEAETDKRREDALKKLLTTPHKPHKQPLKGIEKKLGKAPKKRPKVD